MKKKNIITGITLALLIIAIITLLNTPTTQLHWVVYGKMLSANLTTNTSLSTTSTIYAMPNRYSNFIIGLNCYIFDNNRNIGIILNQSYCTSLIPLNTTMTTTTSQTTTSTTTTSQTTTSTTTINILNNPILNITADKLGNENISISGFTPYSKVILFYSIGGVQYTQLFNYTTDTDGNINDYKYLDYWIKYFGIVNWYATDGNMTTPIIKLYIP